MKISVHSTINNKFYDVYYSLKNEAVPPPLERVFRNTFVKDLLHFNYNLEMVKESLNARGLNINIYEIKEVENE